MHFTQLFFCYALESTLWYVLDDKWTRFKGGHIPLNAGRRCNWFRNHWHTISLSRDPHRFHKYLYMYSSDHCNSQQCIAELSHLRMLCTGSSDWIMYESDTPLRINGGFHTTPPTPPPLSYLPIKNSISAVSFRQLKKESGRFHSQAPMVCQAFLVVVTLYWGKVPDLAIISIVPSWQQDTGSASWSWGLIKPSGL